LPDLRIQLTKSKFLRQPANCRLPHAGNFFELCPAQFKLAANCERCRNQSSRGKFQGVRTENNFLLCLLAAVHVFIFSAAFPFFNNVDEQAHFDLAMKYAQGHLPRQMEPPAAEVTPYVVIFGTREFLWPSNDFPAEQFPPPWTQPMEKIRPILVAETVVWRNVTNYEASQPPLYYTLAALWWDLGKVVGLHDGFLLYWLRFLNVILIIALVWLGYLAARLVFPGQIFLQIGVPALIAFIPQTAFYSIQNDVLSPLCFGVAFICLVKFLDAETPGVRLGIFTGLALAATFLTKISNLPLLAISALVILFKTAQLLRTGKLRGAFPSLAAWLAWCKYAFGDFSGTTAKIQFLGWTHKPFGEWWHHPIFTLHGLWTFLSGLLATFWQGEFVWHGQPLALPWANLAYVLASIILPGMALLNLLPQFKNVTALQRQALWFSFGCFAAAIAFLGFLSIIYDFQDCFYPSREHPYFTSGRLMLGALIPFLLLFVFGLNQLLNKFGNAVKFSVLAAIILFMLITEIGIDWPVFQNPYNWFHM
jgi:hypothetical protein